MKNIYKLILVSMFFVLTNTVYAVEDINDSVCSSEETIELYTIASHVAVDFKYEEQTETFDLILENMNQYLSAQVAGKLYKYSSKGVVIKGFKEGEKVKIDLIASEYSECFEKSIKSIQYVLPYINRFLDTSECELNADAEICNTKFTDYRLTYNLLKKMLQKEEKKKTDIIIEKKEQEIYWYDKWLIFIDDYGMQIGLFLLGTIATIIVGHGVLIRAKSKF